ncbi:hypothetical protein [Oceanicola sp. S124]|uniref:hypothetical protein n=1 Tax=Oceanicola sp. S124 TaxID=1042378 RepID=UPI000255A961|nr:hypothetical protein [Oceanicola sp. S124]
MPKMVTIEPNPDFSPSAVQKKAFTDVQKVGAKLVPYQTALQNIKASEGMYRLKPDEQAAPQVVVPQLEDLSNDELKLMMLRTGVKTDKQMKRGDIIKVIRSKLEEIEIIDDETA